LVVATLAYAWFLPLGADWSYWLMLPAFVLLGVSFALTYGPFAIASTENVADEEQGLASALLNVAIQFGSALGIAAVTMVEVAVAGAGATSAEQLEGYRAALVVPVVAVALGAAITGVGLVRGRGLRVATGD